MDSEEHGQEQRVIYNVILVTVTVLGIACSTWTRYSAPPAPSVTLNSLSAVYKKVHSDSYPENKKYDDAKFFLNITVTNMDTKREAKLDYLDVWVNSRKRTFLRSKLGQRISLDTIVLGAKERKDFVLHVDQDRPIKKSEWSDMLVSVFVRATFKDTLDFRGNPKEAHKTRDCIDLTATLNESAGTAIVYNDKFPMECDAPY